MGRVNDLIAAAKAIASDNRNVYGKYPNNMGPYTWDCCTFLSKALYDCGIAPGEWYDNGYFWPHISEAGFDWFLLSVCGMTKLDYVGDGMLIPGDILISRESYGHTAMFLGDWKMIEAHDQYSSAEQIGIHEWYEYDWCYVYRLPGEYDPPQEEKFPARKLNWTEWRVLNIFKWSVPVKKGDCNDFVEFVQKYLAYWGHYSGAIDKDFGALTESAVKDWQRVNGLEQTGMIAVNEWNIIFADSTYKA